MLYETAQDRVNEDRVAAIFGLYFGSGGVKLPSLNWADRSYLFGELFAEIKCRTCPSTRHDTYFITAKKFYKARSLRQPTVMVVEWTDNRIGVLSIHKPAYFRVGGRFDRPGDPSAIEQMAHYYVDNFRMIR